MRYVVISTESYDANKVLEKYPCLLKYDPVFLIEYGCKWVYIQIDTMEQLIQMVEELDAEVIIRPNSPVVGKCCLEIFDDYGE